MSENQVIYQPDITAHLEQARDLSWQHFGKKITFYLPGMFTYNDMTGRYPAVSITGDECALMCDHCKGKILSDMVRTDTPDLLVETCQKLEKKGMIGVLITGGCNSKGELPWEQFIHAVKKIKETTRLLVSVHSGFVNGDQAREMKEAGVDQALIDVIGDKDTFETIYLLPFGPKQMEQCLFRLVDAGIEVVPHIVCGLNHGRIQGEADAVSIVSLFDVKKLVIVSLMRLTGTPLHKSILPGTIDVANIIVKARMKMPATKINLGCARRRGDVSLEVLAVKAGINSIALPSDEAIQQAEEYHLDIRYQKTCCSVSADFSTPGWQLTAEK